MSDTRDGLGRIKPVQPLSNTKPADEVAALDGLILRDFQAMETNVGQGRAIDSVAATRARVNLAALSSLSSLPAYASFASPRVTLWNSEFTRISVP